MIDTGEILLSALNCLPHNCAVGGDGYSGGGGEGDSNSRNGGNGGTDGGDGKVGAREGGKGSGLDIGSIAMNHYQMYAGKGGENQGYFGGGGGGIVVCGLGPDTGYTDGYGAGSVGVITVLECQD